MKFQYSTESTSIIVSALTSFYFNAFWKRFDMLSQPLVLPISKKVSSYMLVLGQQPPIAVF